MTEHGFVVITEDPTFASEKIADLIREDGGFRHVVYVPHEHSDPRLGRMLSARGAEIVLFGEYGAPDNVQRIAALPPDGLLIIVSDLHRMVGNRLDLRLQYLYTRHRARKKVVVDSVPYEAQPWRVFFPLGLVDKHLLAYNHSYAIEQDYDKFLDGYIDHNPCAAETIAAKTKNAVFVDRDHIFGREPEVTEVPAGEHLAEYERYRDELFVTQKSITGVKKRLDAWVQERFPERSVPVDLRSIYAGLGRLVVTDLPFDRWLVSEIRGLIRHTDTLMRLWCNS